VVTEKGEVLASLEDISAKKKHFREQLAKKERAAEAA